MSSTLLGHLTQFVDIPSSHIDPATVPLLFPILFFNDTATTEIYTLSLHDALPILAVQQQLTPDGTKSVCYLTYHEIGKHRLNSSHTDISYAVFCLKKK